MKPNVYLMCPLSLLNFVVTVLEWKLKVLRTNCAQSSVVDTEESRQNHNESTNWFCYTVSHEPVVDIQILSEDLFISYEKNTLSDHGNIHGHRRNECSAITRHRNFTAPKICKITVIEPFGPFVAVVTVLKIFLTHNTPNFAIGPLSWGGQKWLSLVVVIVGVIVVVVIKFKTACLFCSMIVHAATNYWGRAPPSWWPAAESTSANFGEAVAILSSLPLYGLSPDCRSTVWCSEIGPLTSLNAPVLHASSDVREPISLHQAVDDSTCVELMTYCKEVKGVSYALKGSESHFVSEKCTRVCFVLKVTDTQNIVLSNFTQSIYTIYLHNLFTQYIY